MILIYVFLLDFNSLRCTYGCCRDTVFTSVYCCSNININYFDQDDRHYRPSPNHFPPDNRYPDNNNQYPDRNIHDNGYLNRQSHLYNAHYSDPQLYWLWLLVIPVVGAVFGIVFYCKKNGKFMGW